MRCFTLVNTSGRIPYRRTGLELLHFGATLASSPSEFLTWFPTACRSKSSHAWTRLAFPPKSICPQRINGGALSCRFVAVPGMASAVRSTPVRSWNQSCVPGCPRSEPPGKAARPWGVLDRCNRSFAARTPQNSVFYQPHLSEHPGVGVGSENNRIPVVCKRISENFRKVFSPWTLLRCDRQGRRDGWSSGNHGKFRVRR